MSYDFTELNKVVANWATDDTTRFKLPESKSNNIVCNVGATEMLRVAEDGFYVRGEKITVDDREAATVYTAFKEFLVWSRLSRE